MRRRKSRRTRVTLSPPTICAPGDDGRREAGDAVRGRIAVQLQQVRLQRVEREDADARRERGGQHQPADGRVAQAAVDRALAARR